jgi:Cu-Zn family superoxide dismutase
MDSKISRYRVGLIGVAALVMGCSADTDDRDGSAQSRPGDSALSRNESGQPPASTNRDASVRSPADPAAGAAAPAPQLIARAQIQPLAESTVRGVVEFQQAGSTGPMTVHVMLMGLSAGPHGLHVHTGSDCAAPGEHLNPLDSPHGPANAAAGMRHLGDLGNVTADASGMVEEMLRDSLLGGDATFVGKALVVHEGQDDLSTQPDGSSGRPIGCGVIEAAGEDVLSSSDAPNRGV